ncbi:serine aminopeptidase domain-containing protein [Bordetella trematum]|uniref:serine aminopeptidase domain-containing protein n=1 Tax=Bordetella trematum TaxID=123899 RepID=UPI0015C5475E|nr:alpha/beta hydrolase [Bordetella trematum]
MPLHSARRAALPLCLLLLASHAAQAQPAVHQLTRADGSAIIYYLQAPLQAQPGVRELLVIAQGSDCNSVARHPALWQALPRARPQAEVLAVEKYGLDARLPYRSESPRTDCPADYLKHDNPAQRVADLSAVLDRLGSEAAYDNIIALGGSEGAVIVHLLAARGQRLDAAATFNGGGRWFEDDMMHSATIEAASLPPADRAALLAGMRGFIAHARAGQDTSMTDHGPDWWQQMLSLDQAAVMRAIAIPTLVIQSGRDTSVSAEAAQAMIAAAANPRLSWRSYPELDHGLREADGTPAMARVAGDIAQWLDPQLDAAR